VMILFIISYLLCVHYPVFVLHWLLGEFSYIVPLYYILQHKPSTITFILFNSDHTVYKSSLTCIKRIFMVNHIKDKKM
jgi:hypothetical protein